MPDESDIARTKGLTRRGFLKGVGAAAVASDALLNRAALAAALPPGPADLSGPVDGPVEIALSVNGQNRKITVEPRVTLLNVLRDRLDPPVTGPKLVCDAGACGACTVLLDDKPVYACSVLAIDAVGKKITTSEGLGTPAQPSDLQKSFVDKDAMMCGFCTPGFVVTLTAFLKENRKPTPDQIRQACKGNFCRCGTYPHVFAAAMSAASPK